MARYWKAFKSEKERKEWEKQEKNRDDCFKVCFHFSAKDLEKELYMPKGCLTDEDYRFCTVYCFMEKKEF